MSPPSLPVAPTRGPSRLRKRIALGLTVFAILFGVLIFLRIIGALGYYRVPTGSMSPAVSAGDHVFSDGASYWFREPERGEIIVFETIGIRRIMPPPGQISQIYMARLVGLPGDTVSIRESRVYVNGEMFEPNDAVANIEYTEHGPSSKWTVPKQSYFVLGDNSANSFDSRGYGFVPAKNVMSRVVLRIFPSIRPVE